jgi:2-amino-4-hydroxy-6-hydroxymethyldihydropteridine diphosphokinase
LSGKVDGMAEVVKAFIGLGSNLGDGRVILQQAWQALADYPGILLDGLSSPYRTAPVGMRSSNWFINAVGRMKTSLAPEELLTILLTVEQRFGRNRDGKGTGYQDRSLDLDLLYFGDMVLSSDILILPHPRIGDRLFVLQPLMELDLELRVGGNGVLLAERVRLLMQQMESGEIERQEIIADNWQIS